MLSPTSFRVEYKRGVGTVFQRNLRFHIDINLATPGALCNQDSLKKVKSIETNNNQDQTQCTISLTAASPIQISQVKTTSLNEENVNVINNKNNALNVNSKDNNCSSSVSEAESNLINNLNNNNTITKNAINNSNNTSSSSNNANSINNQTLNNNLMMNNKKPLLYVLTFTLISGPVRRFKRICDHIQVQISNRSSRPTTINVHNLNSTSNSTQSSNSNLSTNSGKGGSGESNLSLAINSNTTNNNRELKINLSNNSSSSSNAQQHFNNNPVNLSAISNCTPTAQQQTNNLNLSKSPKQTIHSKNRDLSDSSCGSCVSENRHSSLNNNQSSDENMTVNLISNSIRTTSSNNSATTSNLIANKNCQLSRCKSENPQTHAVTQSQKNSGVGLFSNVPLLNEFEKDKLNQSNGKQQTSNVLRLLSNRKFSQS